MTSQTLVRLILFGNIGLWLIVFLFAWRGLRASYSRPVPSGFAFRRPWEHCTCLGLLGILSLLMPLVVATNDLRLYGAVLPNHWPYLRAFAGICVVDAALFWWVGCPVELTLDEERRTYRRTAGWSPFSRTCTGPFSDLTGVGAMIGGGSTYFVYIGLRKGRVVAERFSSAEGAEYYADELAAMLGVPRLEPGSCRWPQLSRQQQRAYAEAANVLPTYRRCRRYLPRFAPHLRSGERPARAAVPRANENPVD